MDSKRSLKIHLANKLNNRINQNPMMDPRLKIHKISNKSYKRIFSIKISEEILENKIRLHFLTQIQTTILLVMRLQKE